VYFGPGWAGCVFGASFCIFVLLAICFFFFLFCFCSSFLLVLPFWFFCCLKVCFWVVGLCYSRVLCVLFHTVLLLFGFAICFFVFLVFLKPFVKEVNIFFKVTFVVWLGLGLCRIEIHWHL